MTPPWGLILTTLLLAALAGCATTPNEATRIARSYNEHVYSVWTLPPNWVLYGVPPTPNAWPAPGPEVVTEGCPKRPDNIWENAVPCVEVPGTRDLRDTEYWKFELYLIVQASGPYGIPVGPKYKSDQTLRIGVVGPRESCETLRAHFVKPKGVPFSKAKTAQDLGVLGDDGEPWTEPCEGPFYFRRMSQEVRP